MGTRAVVRSFKKFKLLKLRPNADGGFATLLLCFTEGRHRRLRLDLGWVRGERRLARNKSLDWLAANMPGLLEELVAWFEQEALAPVAFDRALPWALRSHGAWLALEEFAPTNS